MAFSIPKCLGAFRLFSALKGISSLEVVTSRAVHEFPHIA